MVRDLFSAFAAGPWAIDPDSYRALAARLAAFVGGAQALDVEAAARPRASASGAVAVIPISGPITQRASIFSEYFGGTSLDRFTSDLRRAVADPTIKAIVLNVDSPGGSVFGVPEAAAEIREARKVKHVAAVANARAGSAAYWLAAQADDLSVTPSGQVGSIGVFAQHDDVSAALEREGVRTTLISAGRFKVEDSPFAPLSEEARAAIQSSVDDYYVAFIGDVAAGRNRSRADVRSGFGEGRMVGADAAVKAGMADRVATFDEVIARLGASSSSQRLTAESSAVEPSAARRRWIEIAELAVRD